VSPDDLSDRIKQAFAKYEDTVELLRDLLSRRENAEEIVILACARLDALANLSGSRGRAGDRFSRFIETYSGKKAQLRRLAVGDLYSYMGREYMLLPLTVPAAGRILNLGGNSLPFLRFLADSGLPLEDDALSRCLRRVSVAIQRKYRTTASQSRTKPTEATVDEFVQHVADDMRQSTWREYEETLTKALRGIASGFRLSSLIYREVRSGAIHEHGFHVNQRRFFSERHPFVGTVRHPWEDTLYLGVHIPGPWLVDLVAACTRNYQKHLLQTRKLPADLFFSICDPLEEEDYLDLASLPGEEPVALAIGR
jgi:hypothetical protein